ncbi:MAG TPA: hypothetical protein VF432_32045 [Thermoanaerobaculia bacterium]
MTTIPIPDPSPHEDNAQAIRQELQRLMQGVPGLTLLTTEGRRRIAVSGHVDPDFLRSMALLIEAHGDIAVASQLTSAEIREHLSFAGPHQEVGEELMLNGRKMIDTVIASRASVGERALLALKIARSINTPAERAALVPHLEAIDREFSRGRRRRPAAKKPDEDVPKKPEPEPKPKPEVKP